MLEDDVGPETATVELAGRSGMLEPLSLQSVRRTRTNGSPWPPVMNRRRREQLSKNKEQRLSGGKMDNFSSWNNAPKALLAAQRRPGSRQRDPRLEEEEGNGEQETEEREESQADVQFRKKPLIKIKRQQHDRQLNVARNDSKVGQVMTHQKVYSGRFHRPHLVLDRLKRNVVYNEPFSVLNHHVLSGERDKELMQLEARESAEKVQKQVPNALRERHGVAKMTGKHYLQRLTYLCQTDPKAFFKLQLPKFKQAVHKLQAWWRAVIARRRAAELRSLFVVTRFDTKTGMFYRCDSRTGQSEWIY
jgi:hypothetical protein